MPVLGLSADQGTAPDVAASIRPFATDVRGETIAGCGHFQPEEKPDAVADALLRFLNDGREPGETQAGPAASNADTSRA